MPLITSISGYIAGRPQPAVGIIQGESFTWDIIATDETDVPQDLSNITEIKLILKHHTATAAEETVGDSTIIEFNDIKAVSGTSDIEITANILDQAVLEDRGKFNINIPENLYTGEIAYADFTNIPIFVAILQRTYTNGDILKERFLIRIYPG